MYKVRSVMCHVTRHRVHCYIANYPNNNYYSNNNNNKKTVEKKNACVCVCFNRSTVKICDNW